MSNEPLGEGPIEPVLYGPMNDIARVLDAVINCGAKGEERPYGFVLWVYPFGERAGRCNFISNSSDLRDVVTLMKEMIIRFENQQSQPAAARH